MFKKNKYDIMKKEMKGMSLFSMSLALKLISLTIKAETGKISDEQIDIELASITPKLLSITKMAGHICYEICKDIENADSRRVSEYIKKHGINPIKFIDNYNKTKKYATQMLFTFAVFDRDNIQFSTLKNPEMALKLLDGGLNGKGLEDFLDCLSGENDYALSKLISAYDNDSELNEDDMQLIENYHRMYMSKSISPYVTRETTEEEIVRHVKTISRMKRNNNKM